MTLAPDPVILDVSPAGVAEILLNRPQAGNAIDVLLIQGLADALETLRGADHVRVVIVRGAGDVFCVGSGPEWLGRQGERDGAQNEADFLAFGRALKALHDLPQMTIAMIKGAAYGGGVGLAAACDVCIAMRSTGFRFAEPRVGLAATMVAPFVVEAIGPRWAKALMVSTETFDGGFAEKIGLVQFAVDTEKDFDAMGEHIAKLAFTTAPGAVAEVKSALREVVHEKLDDHLIKSMAKRLAHLRESDEGREGVAALLEGRKPSWEG